MGMIPTLLEIQNYFFYKGNRNSKTPKQFYAYYNAVGWPKNWKEYADQFLKVHTK